MQQSRKMADHGAMQTALRTAVIRMATQMMKMDPAGAPRFIGKLRHQNFQSVLHAIEDPALRSEIDDLDAVLARISRAKPEEIAATERSLNGTISPYRSDRRDQSNRISTFKAR